MSADHSRWFKRFDETGWPTFTLFCFPYAGGNANAYRRWASLVHPDIDVVALSLPGRGPRAKEVMADDFDALIEPIAKAVMAETGGQRFGFFGHSMGALMMFEVSRRLVRHKARLPSCIFASGRRAPHLKSETVLHAGLDDDAFVAELRRLQGTPPEILDTPALRTLFLPVIRRDLALLQRWRLTTSPPLPLPIYALAGAEDPHAPAATVNEWSSWTDSTFEMTSFPGGHFFLRDQEKTVVSAISERVMRHV